MSALDLIFQRLSDSGLGVTRLPYVTRAVNQALTANDNGGWFDLTGTFTQTLSDAASIGADKFFVLRNSGAGDVTLDPDGSELIDGLASYVMYPGEVRLIQCDGAQFRSLVMQPFTRYYTTSGTFIKPPGYSAFELFINGGDGGGAGGSYSTNNTAYRGGQGGQASMRWLPFVRADRIDASVTVTVGAGGAPGVNGTASSSPTAGVVGGESSFGTIIAGNGGGGGNVPTAGGSNGAPGASGLSEVSPSSSISFGFPSTRVLLKTPRGGSGGEGRSTNVLTPAQPTGGERGEVVVRGVI